MGLIIKLERWKTYPFDKQYKISSEGRIKFRGKIMPQYVNEAGYLTATIMDKVYLVHRLVAQTYLGLKAEDILTVDHLDRNKRNNCVKNLEVISKLENQLRASVVRQETDLIMNKIEQEAKSEEDYSCRVQSIIGKNTKNYTNWIDIARSVVPNPTEQQIKNISKNVQKAIRNQTPYCSKYWFFVEQ